MRRGYKIRTKGLGWPGWAKSSPRSVRSLSPLRYTHSLLYVTPNMPNTFPCLGYYGHC